MGSTLFPLDFLLAIKKNMGSMLLLFNTIKKYFFNRSYERDNAVANDRIELKSRF